VNFLDEKTSLNFIAIPFLVKKIFIEVVYMQAMTSAAISVSAHIKNFYRMKNFVESCSFLLTAITS
jgi:hypothetical protein